MIPKQSFVNKIRELGYTFKQRQKRTELWRKKGGTHYILVRLSDYQSEEAVASALRQAGLSAEEIRSFIGSAKS